MHSFLIATWFSLNLYHFRDNLMKVIDILLQISGVSVFQKYWIPAFKLSKSCGLYDVQRNSFKEPHMFLIGFK